MDYTEDTNPRLEILLRDIEQAVLKPMRSHGWATKIVSKNSRHDCIEIEVQKQNRVARVGFLYSSGIQNAFFRELGERCERIFIDGSLYRMESFAHGVRADVDILANFFPYLVSLNKEIDADVTPKSLVRRKRSHSRIIDETPIEGIRARLEVLTSTTLAKKLVEKRAFAAGYTLTSEAIENKSQGIAFTIRNFLDLVSRAPSSELSARVIGLYYGCIALASAEMLAAPEGVADLDEIEGATKLGHGLYTVSSENGILGGLVVGVLATGFFPKWLSFLGHDTTRFPTQRAKSASDLMRLDSVHYRTLESLFSSVQELEGVFNQIFESAQGWLIPTYDSSTNNASRRYDTNVKAGSTYGLFLDPSGLVDVEQVHSAGWPLAEIQRVPASGSEDGVSAFRARVDHVNFDSWWEVLPTHSSRFGHQTTMIFPTLGGVTEYRAVAIEILYALSIVVRYLPSMWRQIVGGKQDQYLPLINEAIRIWENLLPQLFLEGIIDEKLTVTQQGSFFS